MRKLIFLLLGFFILQSAQSQSKIDSLANARSYAATDTTGWKNTNAFSPYVLQIFARDSINVTIRLDYRGAGAGTTVFKSFNVEADSTNSTDSVGFFKGTVLRSGFSDNIPGATQVRLILTRKTTKNGTSSPTYDALLLRQ